MTDAELLAKVKTGLFGSSAGEWHDEVLQIYIDEVKAFRSSAGVRDEVLSSEASVGCILTGVNDLWHYQPGGARFSEYFKMRMMQMTGGGSGAKTE